MHAVHFSHVKPAHSHGSSSNRNHNKPLEFCSPHFFHFCFNSEKKMISLNNNNECARSVRFNEYYYRNRLLFTIYVFLSIYHWAVNGEVFLLHFMIRVTNTGGVNFVFRIGLNKERNLKELNAFDPQTTGKSFLLV